MQEAARQQSVENIAEDGDHEEGAMQKEEAAIQVGGNLARREMEILAKERELIQKEVELLRRENDIAGFPEEQLVDNFPRYIQYQKCQWSAQRVQQVKRWLWEVEGSN